MGKELPLDFASCVEIILETKFILPRFLVEPCVFQCHRNEGRQSRQHALVFRREGARLRAFKVEHADEAVLQEKRNDELGPRSDAGLATYITRIAEHVVHADGAPLGGCGSGQASVERQTQKRRNGILITHSEHAFEQLARFVPQHHAKNMVVDNALDTLRDAAQQLLAIQNGGQLAAYVIEQRKRLGLLGERTQKALGNRVHIAKNGVRAELGEIVHFSKVPSELFY